MKIMDFLNKDSIIVDLKSIDKKSAIIELVDVLKDTGKIDETKEIINIIFDREKLSSTGIGQGVAIPHCKTNIINKQFGALGISHKGIEFNSLDGELVYIIFLFISKKDVDGQHFKALSKISRLFKNKNLRESIKKSTNINEIIKIINQYDNVN
jgi:PTS system nitrogen regulatory IIA component